MRSDRPGNDELLKEAKALAARRGRTLNDEARDHDRYRAWLTETVKSPEPFGVSELALSAVVRITTNPRILYLAALAIESGSEWITADRGFARFPGLRRRHPLDDPR